MLFENNDVVIQNVINTVLVKELEKEYNMKAVKAFKYSNLSYGVFSIYVKLVEISEEKYCEQIEIEISNHSTNSKKVKRFNWLNPFYKEKLTNLEDI